MATSNSYDFSATASDAIQEAAEILELVEVGETVEPAHQTSMLRTLNMMVKQWSANFDFAPGLKAFSRKHGYVFLQSGQAEYSIGPSGDNASLSYVTTTMRVAASANATTLEVTSTTGISTSDKIGIELDSGSIYWTTVSGVTDSDTLTIPATGLTGAAAAGNRIFAYTTKLIRPLYIESAVLRDTDGNDTPVYAMTAEYYENLPRKADEGDPCYYLYENTLTNGKLYFDYEPNDVTKVLRISFMAPAEDYDAVANDIAYPQEWILPIATGLAKNSATKFGVTWTPQLEAQHQEALRMARSSYAETTEEYFQPGLE